MAGTCSNNVFTYTEVILTNTSALPSFMTLLSANNTLQVYTTSSSNVGSYSIQVTSLLTGDGRTTIGTFTVDVIAATVTTVTNTAPYFIINSDYLDNITLFAG
jgi:hypothetical protein